MDLLSKIIEDLIGEKCKLNSNNNSLYTCINDVTDIECSTLRDAVKKNFKQIEEKDPETKAEDYANMENMADFINQYSGDKQLSSLAGIAVKRVMNKINCVIDEINNHVPKGGTKFIKIKTDLILTGICGSKGVHWIITLLMGLTILTLVGTLVYVLNKKK
jgi:hypothetical protein